MPLSHTVALSGHEDRIASIASPQKEAFHIKSEALNYGTLH